MAIRITDPVIIKEPPYPTDPTGCPTCLSGTPPIEPWYEVAVEVQTEKTVG